KSGYSLGTVAGWSMTPQLRYYLPTSEKSQNNHMIGIIQTRLYSAKVVDRFEFLNVLMPGVGIQSEATTKQYQGQLTNYFEVQYRTHPNFSFLAGAEAGWKKLRGS